MDAVSGPAAGGDARGDFVSRLSAKFDRFVEKWDQRGKQLSDESFSKLPSTVNIAIGGKDRNQMHRLVSAWCDQFVALLAAEWSVVFREFLGDVSVDLLQFSKQPLAENEVADLTARHRPVFLIKVTEPGASGMLTSIATGAAVGAAAGAPFAGVGALPGAIFGALGGFVFGNSGEISSILQEAKAASAKALADSSLATRVAKLNIVEQVVALRWNPPA